MDIDQDSSQRRVPSLVQLCQRAAVAHVDLIHSLGDDLTYALAKPILERCTADQLLKIEQSSPHLQDDTPEIWKDLCYRKYRLMAIERYCADDDPQEPDSWKARYFVLQEAETKRIEEVGSRLRSHRMEEVERKKEREVKFTDRVPPPKRARTGSGWNSTIQPRSLFQKTRTEASKIQKTMYNARVLPPMPTAKNYRVLPQPCGANFPRPSSSSNRVTVNTIIQKRPSTYPSGTPSSKGVISSPTPATLTPGSVTPIELSPPAPRLSTSCTNSSSASSPPSIRKSEPSLRVVRSPSAKKDPMALMFVPKHRAYSQRPV